MLSVMQQRASPADQQTHAISSSCLGMTKQLRRVVINQDGPGVLPLLRCCPLYVHT